MASTRVCTVFEALANQKTGEFGNRERSESEREHRPSIRLKSQSGTEHVHYSLTYEGFPDEFQVQAEKKNKETPEGRKRGIQRLKEFMKRENLPPLKDDVLLLTTLRNCKYNLKNAESKLKKLISVRQKVGGMLREVGMEAVGKIVDDMPFGFLPYRDKCGRAIVYTRPYGLNLDQYSLADVSIVSVAGVLFALSFPISVSGFAYFAQCKSPSLYLLYSIIKEFRAWIFRILSLPIRVGRVEVLNENSLCRYFLRFLQTFISSKIMSRITLHGSDNEQMLDMYGPNLLPEEFGGNAGPISSESYKQKFLDFVRDLMDEDCRG